MRAGRLEFIPSTWALNPFTDLGETETDWQTDHMSCETQSRKRCPLPVPSAPQTVWSQLGHSERIGKCFVFCTNFFAPGFCYSCHCHLSHEVSHRLYWAVAETTWGADGSIPFSVPSLSRFVVGSCCWCSLINFGPVVTHRPVCTPSNSFCKTNKNPNLPKVSLLKRCGLCAGSFRLHVPCFSSKCCHLL